MLPGLGNRCLITDIKVRISKKCFFYAGQFCLDSGPGGFKTKGVLSSLLVPAFTLFLISCLCDLILLLRLLPLLFLPSFIPPCSGAILVGRDFLRLLETLTAHGVSPDDCSVSHIVTAFSHDFILIFRLEVETLGSESKTLSPGRPVSSGVVMELKKFLDKIKNFFA